LRVGLYLTEQLNRLIGKYEWVGDVRGCGLFQGIEFVKKISNEIIQPHPILTKFLVDHLRYDRVIVSRDGPDENVIKIKPPLVFSKVNVDMLVKALTSALDNAVTLGVF
jgi:4-aminobutyrate aminotransferase-like enzyme